MIKKIFGWLAPQEQKKVRSVVLKPKDLRPYVTKKIGEANEGLTKSVDKIRKHVDEGRERLLAALILLKDATLHNPNVPLKAVQFMEGNRDAYIKKVKLIEERLDIPTELSEIREYCSWIIGKIHTFYTSTSRAYDVLQEFFQHESGDVQNIMRGFEKLMIDLRERIDAAEITKYEELLRKISHLENILKKRKTMVKDELDKKHEIQILEKKITEVTAQIDRLLSSHRFEEIKEMKSMVIFYNDKSKHIESEVRHKFSIIEKAMKKYAKIAASDTELIQEYLNSPVKTLIKDSELKILNILSNIRTNILSNAVVLDEKKKKKTMAGLDMLDLGYLNKMQNSLIDIKSSSEEVVEQVDKSETNKKYKVLLEKKESLEKEKVAITKNMISYTKDDSTEINQWIGDITRIANNVFDEEIQVTI